MKKNRSNKTWDYLPTATSTICISYILLSAGALVYPSIFYKIVHFNSTWSYHTDLGWLSNLIYKACDFHKPPDTSITTVFFDSQVCRVCCTILQRQKILDKKELDSILELLCTLHKMHVFIWCFGSHFLYKASISVRV